MVKPLRFPCQGSQSRVLEEERSPNQRFDSLRLRWYLQEEAEKNQFRRVERQKERHKIPSDHGCKKRDIRHHSHGLSYGGRKTMQKTRIYSQSIMHSLMEAYGLSATKLERRALTDTARISPGGPDPQHD
ncbi:hypothetical protein GQ457_05G028850 [Hibiscus cannabinus]